MAVNIGPKIGIDGEAEFRKELKGIIQETKTLAAESDAAAAAFKNESDNEEKAKDAAEKHSKAIEAQKKLIDKLEEAVKKSIDATGENSQETLKWKEQLAKARSGLETLESQTKETTGGVKDLGEAEDTTSSKTSTFGDVLKANLASKAIQKGLELTKKIAQELAEFFVDAVKGAAEYADEITTLSKTTGLGTDTLQEYGYIAKLVDVDLSTITGSMTKLKRNMDSARDGNAAAKEAFEKLGISITDANGELRDSEDVFNDALAALREIKNPTERDAAAMDIFGKSATELNPLIETSAENLEALKKEAHDAGAVLSKDTISSLNEVQDSMDRMGLSWDALKKELGARIGKAILPDLEKALEIFREFQKTGDTTKLVDGISRGIQNFSKKLIKSAPKIAKEFGKALGAVLGNAPALISAGLEIGWALLKGLLQAVPEMGRQFVKSFDLSMLKDSTVEALNKMDELRQKIADLPKKTDRVADSLGDINAKQREAEHWIEIFDELSKKTNPTAEDTAKLQAAVDKLNELYPELGLKIDEETGKWSHNTQEIRNNIEAMSARYQAEAYYAAASDALKEIATIEAETRGLRQNTKALGNAIDNRKAVQKVYADELLELNKLEYAYQHGAMDVGTYTEALRDMGYTTRGDAIARMNELSNAMNKNAEEINNLQAQYDAGKETLDVADARIKQLNGDVEWLFKQGAKWETQAYVIGKQLPAGLVKGIKSGTTEVEKAAGLMMTNAIKRMKAVAQISSPSKVTENLIGKNLALGVIKGWEDVMDPAKLAKAFTLTPVFSAMTAGGTTNTTNNTTNLGGVSVNVYPASGTNIDALTDAIMIKMQRAVNKRKAVFSNELHLQ